MPAAPIAGLSISDAVFDGDDLYAVDRYGPLYPAIGGRLGPIVDGTDDADQIVGVAGGRIVYRYNDSVYSMAVDLAAADDSFRGGNMTLALTARDPVLGPDGSLWYTARGSDHEPGLHRIVDASSTDPIDNVIDVPARSADDRAEHRCALCHSR